MPYRLETNVDLLKAEVESMQKAMQQGNQPLGNRQSVRLASIQSHQQATQAATVTPPEENANQRLSDLAAPTPERELESGIGSKRCASTLHRRLVE